MPRHCLSRRLVLTLAVLSVWGSHALTQPPPLAPDPKAPVLNPIAPLGVQRGQAIDLTLTGSNLAVPTGILLSFPGKVVIPSENNNGKDPAKLLVRLEVPADAPLGFHTLRLATAYGMSNFRIFCIDDLPQVLETDTNRSRDTAQAVPVPCVVAGRCDVAESADWYKVSVKAGQRLSFEVLGRRLGSAFDPQITIFDPRTGREVLGGHSNDAPGLQTDPRLTHTFKDAGDYLVEIRDVSYRGGADFWYRLRIGDFPCATTPLPLAVKRGTQTTVRFAGPNVDGVAPVEILAPADPEASVMWVAPKGANGLYGWPVSLALSDLHELLETEPNDEPAKANRVSVPGAITGRLQQKGDVDHYVFATSKGQRTIIEAHTHDLHSPAELYLVLRDAQGNQLQASNPAVAPRLDFTAPADGDYTLAVEHLHYWGGPDETYRLTFTPYTPGFALSATLDRFGAPQSGVVAIPIHVVRHDYPGPIEVSARGEGVSASLTIPAGQPAQPNQPAGSLQVKVPADLPLGPYAFTIRGRATINGKPFTTLASVREAASQEMAALPVPPRQTWTPLALAVTPKQPFSLVAKFEASPGTPGEPVSVTVTATRDPGFTSEIALAAVGLPANVAAALKNIPANANEAKGQLSPAANAAAGQFPITIVGKVKHKDVDFEIKAAPVPLVLADKPPFTLTAKLETPSTMVGKPAAIVVTATRTPGFTGEIALTIAPVPPNVTPKLKNIDMNAGEARVELESAANTPPGQYAITVTGKAKHKNKDYAINAPAVTLVLTK
jgi:hypothetical protein